MDIAHFEALYAAQPDPWGYATSGYEGAKYAATLAALPRPRYRRALDIGCSIGVLTEQLAPRCDALLALEPVAAALEQARARNARHSHVRFAPLSVPAAWPEGSFDLILASEVLDYLGTSDIAALADRIVASLVPGGDLVLVQWVGKKGPRSDGAESADLLAIAAGRRLVPLHAARNPDYRLDVFRRAGAATGA